jgi:hypothetical protein
MGTRRMARVLSAARRDVDTAVRDRELAAAPNGATGRNVPALAAVVIRPRRIGRVVRTLPDVANDSMAIVRMPDPERAPGYRDGLAQLSHFTVDDFGDAVAGVAPVEGAGAVAKYFDLIKVCDAGSDFDNPEVWAPIRAHPPRQRSDIEDPLAYREQMIARGREIIEQRPSNESEIVAFALAALGAAEAGDLPDLLAVNIPALLREFPNGSLWLVTVADTLLARLAFGRTQLALQLTPDMPVGEEMEQLRAFSELTLTRGIDFAAVMDVPLLAFSPAVLGVRIPAMPHVLIFCFGVDVDLRRPYPTSLASLYRPTVLHDPEGLARETFREGHQPDDGARMLAWWVGRLNVLYSHATDPTRFTDECGFYDAAAQAAWLITIERLVGDGLSLLAEPQATELDRIQLAFDLLDKGESLLGYGKRQTGRGFEALLRQAQSVRRAREAFGSLPEDLGCRLGDEVQRLFDALRAEVRANTLQHRLTERGARVARDAPGTLEPIGDDDLVATLCRAVRNSSHGLLDVLRGHPDRFLLAINTDGIPAELPALAPLLGLALLADAESLIDGSWRRKLVEQR